MRASQGCKAASEQDDFYRLSFTSYAVKGSVFYKTLLFREAAMSVCPKTIGNYSYSDPVIRVRGCLTEAALMICIYF